MPGKTSLPRWVLLADIFAALLAIIFSWVFVSNHLQPETDVRSGLSYYDIIFYICFASITMIGIALNGDYTLIKRYSRLTDIFVVMKSSLISFAVMVCSAFVLEDLVLKKLIEFSRLGIIAMIMSYISGLFLIRLIAHKMQIRAFQKGSWRKKMVIIGTGPSAVDLYDHLKTKQWLGVKCVGFIDEHATSSPVPEVPLLGKVADLQQVVMENEVGEVVIALAPEEHDIMEKIVNNGVRRNVKLRIIPDSFAYPYSNMDIQEYDGLTMIVVSQTRLDAMHSGLKRIIDVAMASFLLIFDLPLMIPIFIMIRLTSKGPAIYRQTRLGKDGEPFKMMKFRSMFVGAEQMRQQLKRQNEAEGAMFKMKEDPRITGFGKIIRRTSLDELPQLINVLKGDMSMVGPRPPLPDEVVRYHAHHLKRLAVRPGVTGLWQISGRDRRNFEEMARLDLFYIENWSTMLDLKIILKTIPVVLSRRGAY